MIIVRISEISTKEALFLALKGILGRDPSNDELKKFHDISILHSFHFVPTLGTNSCQGIEP